MDGPRCGRGKLVSPWPLRWPYAPAMSAGLLTATASAVAEPIVQIGGLTRFAMSAVRASLTSKPRSDLLWPVLYQIGWKSLPVILVTGAFIGMVLAVQTFDQLKMMGMESTLGAVINISLVKELGPVLAAVMLAGRVGSSIAAELGTMKVSEQIDAIDALGADPMKVLVVPRVWGCVLLIPMLTLMADAVGMLSGYVFSTQALGIDSFHYWDHSIGYVTFYDCFTGTSKSILFGAAIAVVSCHRGMASEAGAQGVGRAATEAFVQTFIAILLIDFVTGMIFTPLYYMIWPAVTLADAGAASMGVLG